MFNWKWLIEDQTIQAVFDDVLTQPLAIKPRHFRPGLTSGESAAEFDDLAHFNRFYDHLEGLNAFSDEQIRDFALHGCALIRFGKALMPQSWYFQVAAVEAEEAAVTCMLNSGFEQGNFLILERDERSSLCMLLDSSCEIDVSRELQQFEMIRVLNDRVNPCIWSSVVSSDKQQNLA